MAKLLFGRWQVIWFGGFYFGTFLFPADERSRVSTPLFPDGVIFKAWHIGPIEIRRFSSLLADAAERKAKEEK